MAPLFFPRRPTIKIPFRSASFVGQRHLLLLFYLLASGTATRNHEQLLSAPKKKFFCGIGQKGASSFGLLTDRTIHFVGDVSQQLIFRRIRLQIGRVTTRIFFIQFLLGPQTISSFDTTMMTL